MKTTPLRVVFMLIEPLARFNHCKSWRMETEKDVMNNGFSTEIGFFI